MLDTDDEISSAVRAILDARPTFRVGDRVRVRLSGECPMAADWVHGQDNRIGTITMLFEQTYGESTSDKHDVHVMLAQDSEGRIESGWFTPTELEPLQ
jgi:hypothetical protein